MKFAGVALEKWRERSHDKNSLIADPQFVNVEAFDFSFKPASPALKLGFKPIDTDKIGIRPKTSRKQLKIRGWADCSLCRSF